MTSKKQTTEKTETKFDLKKHNSDVEKAWMIADADTLEAVLHYLDGRIEDELWIKACKRLGVDPNGDSSIDVCNLVDTWREEYLWGTKNPTDPVINRLSKVYKEAYAEAGENAVWVQREKELYG